MAAGKYTLVYVAPERLRHPRFLEAIRPLHVQLLAVDEAHCISEWGHDFRPDYSRLGRFRERLGNPQTIALTATATPHVRADVIEQLQLREPRVFVTGFARPNLRFEVQDPGNAAEKEQLLVDIFRETPGAGIVYASTRRRCEEVRELLESELQRPVGLYHAGLLSEDRRQVQEAFMRGEYEIIVATNAFGMGIDKANLRLVVHFNMPGSLEAYYQEAGRAGRDGLPARCVLLFSAGDRYIQEFFIENAYPSPDVVEQVYEHLCSYEEDPIEITLEQIKEKLKLSIGATGVGACERLLEKCGAIERLESQHNMASVKLDSDLPTLIDMLPRDAHVQRRVLRAVESLVGDRRYEWVYFMPQQLAHITEIERTALHRALRELLRLPGFDFVPPFRGRAIHVLRRACPFDELGIDFEELQRRKAAELERLDRVIHYARTSRCRQMEILDYFGDQRRAPCGCCDNCRPDGPPLVAASAETDDSVHEAIRMALSGVARARGRIGKTLLAKMLCGSRSTQVSRLGLDQLSTFGLLSDLKQTEAIELVDALLEVRLIEKVAVQRHRPTVQLTEEGGRVMRGDSRLDRPLPVGPVVLLKLRQRRRKGSRPSQRPVPSAPLPETAQPSLHEPPAVSSPEVENEPVTGERSHPRNHYWTWRLLSDGYTRDECLQIRQIDELEMLNHLLQAAEDGQPVRGEWFLTREQLALLAKSFPAHRPPPKLRSVADELPPGLRMEHVELYLKCTSRRGESTCVLCVLHLRR